MSLWPYAICDTEEVWAYLNPAQDDRDKFETQMEGWVNGASFILEQHLNRPIVARTFDVYQDGTGRNSFLLDYYPIIKVHSISLSTYDLLSDYDLTVARSSKHVVIDLKNGRVTLLPFAPVGSWFFGYQNIHVVYEAGFKGYELEPFKEAVKELIQVFWKDIGTNPRIQQLNENVGNAFFTGRFDPRKLSHQTQMAVYAFRRVEV